jgi:hypothetical protein
MSRASALPLPSPVLARQMVRCVSLSLRPFAAFPFLRLRTSFLFSSLPLLIAFPFPFRIRVLRSFPFPRKADLMKRPSFAPPSLRQMSTSAGTAAAIAAGVTVAPHQAVAAGNAALSAGGQQVMVDLGLYLAQTLIAWGVPAAVRMTDNPVPLFLPPYSPSVSPFFPFLYTIRNVHHPIRRWRNLTRSEHSDVPLTVCRLSAFSSLRSSRSPTGHRRAILSRSLQLKDLASPSSPSKLLASRYRPASRCRACSSVCWKRLLQQNEWSMTVIAVLASAEVEEPQQVRAQMPPSCPRSLPLALRYPPPSHPLPPPLAPSPSLSPPFLAPSPSLSLRDGHSWSI